MGIFRKKWYASAPLFALLLGASVLAGCDETLSTISETPEIGENAVETVEVDVVAPEAFSITDMALWDGRPTFGGVWIAYPDIEKPERVRIRNDATGKEVIGALYKRERDFPGPKIELSADAAAALGVLAGTPTELTIVALRRKTVEVEVPVVEPEVADDPDMSVPLRRPSAKAAPVPAPAVVTPAVVAPDVAPAEIEETSLPPVKPIAPATGTFIQVATLQSESRAEAVVAKLETAGLTAEIREREAGGKILYRIVVGPANSPEALEIMMATVNQLGYKDAIILR